MNAFNAPNQIQTLLMLDTCVGSLIVTVSDGTVSDLGKHQSSVSVSQISESPLLIQRTSEVATVYLIATLSKAGWNNKLLTDVKCIQMSKQVVV